MFRIKICGITRPEDARTAVEAGADAIGLNFYEKSSRYLAPRHACSLDWSGVNARTVGVFVNMDPSLVAMNAKMTGIGGIQLHGDEPASWLAKMPHIALIRARRMDDRGVAAIAQDIGECAKAGRVPDAVLVDACTPGRYGGTGETVTWSGLADYREWLGDIPLILAGGLTPENVAEAIRIVQPYGVDVASGVESSPGVKCPEKVRLFVSRAKDAFAAI